MTAAVEFKPRAHGFTLLLRGDDHLRYDLCNKDGSEYVWSHEDLAALRTAIVQVSPEGPTQAKVDRPVPTICPFPLQVGRVGIQVSGIEDRVTLWWYDKDTGKYYQENIKYVPGKLPIIPDRMPKHVYVLAKSGANSLELCFKASPFSTELAARVMVTFPESADAAVRVMTGEDAYS